MTETREGTDVVERLRALARHEHSDLSIGHEAADIIDVHRKTIEIANAGWNKDRSELTRLRAENERLREALRTISLMSKEHEHDLFSATQVARNALQETDNG